MAVPVIDLANLAANAPRYSKEIHQACLEYGFFHVVNSGISTDLQANVFDTTREFFHLPLERKRMIKKGDNFRGYFNFLGEITYGKPDWREGIYYFRELKKGVEGAGAAFGGENPWPDEDLPKFKGIITEYFQKATSLGYHLMTAIALALGQEADFFTKKYTDEPFTQFGLFHYPPHDPSSTEDGVEVLGVGEHTDYGNLALLMQDDIGGLQAQTKEGIWIDVPPVPGSIFIMIGDMLEGWTSGAYRAANHRVKTSQKHRISVAVFFDPSLECVISPIPREETTIERAPTKLSLQYPICFGDYVSMKFQNNFPKSTA